MTANILTAGVDIDTKFLARVNTKIADVGYQVAGVDISNRFEARGSATAIANTNLLSAGVDLATLFRDINVPLGPSVAMPAAGYDWLRVAASPATLNINNDGTISHIGPGGAAVTHTWLTGGLASQVDLFISVQSGSFTSGTVATWLNMGTTRTYTRGATLGNYNSTQFTMSFRNASTLAVIGTVSGLYLSCDRI